MWMILDYFASNRTLQEQYKYQDIESLKWMGDETLPQFNKKKVEGYNDGDDRTVG